MRQWSPVPIGNGDANCVCLQYHTQHSPMHSPCTWPHPGSIRPPATPPPQVHVFVDGTTMRPTPPSTAPGSTTAGWQQLCALAARAALVVVEDMPVAPERGWVATLAQHLRDKGEGTGLLAVDTACCLPMQVVGKRYDKCVVGGGGGVVCTVLCWWYVVLLKVMGHWLDSVWAIIRVLDIHKRSNAVHAHKIHTGRMPSPPQPTHSARSASSSSSPPPCPALTSRVPPLPCGAACHSAGCLRMQFLGGAGCRSTAQTASCPCCSRCVVWCVVW